jgi:hypothetical protein
MGWIDMTDDDLTPINSRGGKMKQTLPHCLPCR